MLLFETILKRDPSGIDKFFGSCPLGLKLIVMKGFGFGITTCLQVKESLSSMSQSKKPLSLVSP